MAGVEVVEVVTGRTTAEVRAGRDRAVAGLVELRIDGVDDLDVAAVLAGRRTPVIVTCRARWEGGHFDGSEEERLGILARAVALGAEYVDVEWRADRRRFAERGRTALVVSHHDFERVPADLADRVRAMAAEDADVIKVAVTPSRLGECLTLREAMRLDRPHVAIAMGAAGQVSRLCPWLFGSCWTYGGSNAPGQVTAGEMIDVYRVTMASASTAVYGITGAPLVHSASPAMHNAAFHALGLDAIYVTFESRDADDLLAAAEALGVRGLSVTAPLKPAMHARVASTDDLSAAIGAVNTLRRRDHGWEGRNFDASGFLAPLRREGRRLRGSRAVVLGAGGTARTVTWALAREGARVEVAARRADQAERVAAEFGAAAVPWPPVPGWDLLVNTTPVGTWPSVEVSPLEPAAIGGGLVYDLVYNPRETRLLRLARDAGADVLGGLEMLVGQACHQFEWWTGQPAPAAVMAEAADAFIARTRNDAP
ncbi:MAG: type I 3-dehydroquinate dehydratase [Acidobacteria bacterium]|nr:type I 3-dehydroquinate dehydratase [Acidobacteriota bacterium]